MSSKKALKDVFYSPAGGSFSQRKKAFLGNVKYSGDEKNIFLKSGSGASIYSDVKSLSGDDDNVSMSGGFDSSFLDLAVNTPKAKQVNTGANFSSPIGSLDFKMDEEMKPLPLSLRKKVSLDKIWIDSKIIKTSVEMSVKKSFALDINFLAVEGKLTTQKTQFVRKIFSKINGFGGATTSSKFEGIIRSTFTSKKSMKKAILLAGKNGISINNDLRKQEFHSDWVIVIKEILMNTLKDMIVTTVSEFGQIKLIKIQLIGMCQKTVMEFLFLIGKDSVRVAKAAKDHQFRVLLFTLPVGMTAHDLGTLLEKTGEKTCIINYSLETGNRFCCAVVGFESNEELESAFLAEPIFGGVHLSWARLDLVWCAKCGCFGHSTLECDASVESSSGLPNLFKKLYAKKNVPIFCPAVFGRKLWTQVVSLAFFSGSGLLSGSTPLSFGFSGPQVNGLGDYLAVLEHSLEILLDQVSVILRKLSFVDLVPLVSTSHAPSMAGLVPSALVVDLDMTLDDMLAPSVPLLSGSDKPTAGLSSSGSKVLTSKVDGLKFKLSTLEALFDSILARLDLLCSGSGFNLIWKLAMCNVWSINVPAKQADMIFTFGLDIGYLGVSIAVIINNSLTHYVSRVEKVPGCLISIWLLFKDKLSVTILGLYTGASPGTRFAQTPAVNFLIVKTVNFSIFVILDGNFNENNSGRSVSFKFCLGLGLSNSRGVEKTIDFILVSGTLFSAVVKHCVNSVSDFFNTDHKSVMISVGLGECLDFRIKNADGAGWFHFKECSSAKMLEVKGRFFSATASLDLDAMWSLLEKMVVDSVDEIFFRHWFCDFQCSKNKHSSRFLGLELLVAKIVKCLTSADTSGFDQFMKKWLALDAGKALVLEDMVRGGQKVEDLLSYLLLVRKGYRKSKIIESKLLQETTIRKAIERHIKQFCSDKRSMIRSVLDQPFQKVVLDHLVVNDELILEPKEVRSSVDKIMEGWTWKCMMPIVLSDLWACQYAPLNYVRNDAFFNVMNVISMGKLLLVTNGLPDDKAADLSGISNELWKHGCDKVLECLLVLLNKRACVSMIPKPYDWDGVLTNTQLIALIETARKILSDHIFLACMFAVGLVVEDALEKNREIWLVLQDMQKVYDSVGWPYLKASLRHIKMCKKFIGFFGNIHEDRVNKIMTNFGLSDGYSVHDGLDQVKQHKHLCRYYVDSKFVAKMGRVKDMDKMMSYLAAGAFVDDMIWIGNCQASTQYALNIASEFFEINDISINNDKTGVKVVSLSICDQPISIAKKGKAYCYLGIFLSTEGLSKPSVFKAHSDVRFFVNIVLRKTITDKQFLYLVSAVLQPIVSYQTQFSFVSSGVCHKWDVMIRKSLKSKADLPHDFLDATLYYFSLYGLKTFKQVQFEGKIAALVFFSNASGVLGHLFDHKFLDLQVLGWTPLDPLQFSVKLHVSSVNNFLAGIVKIFLSNELSLANNLSNAFTIQSIDTNILDSEVFSLVKDGLHDIWSSCFEVYTDGSLKNAGLVNAACGATVYFPVLDRSVGVVVGGLLSSILAEFQAAIDACLSELSCAMPDFCNVKADLAAGDAARSPFSLLAGVHEHYLVAKNTAISGNARHFSRDIFQSINRVHWKTGPGVDVIPVDLVGCVDWISTTKGLFWRIVCGGVEFSDHAFTCSRNVVICDEILVEASAHWVLVAGFCDLSSSAVLWTLSTCFLNVGLYSIVCKGFVLDEWCKEAWGVFENKKQAIGEVISFVRFVADLHHVKAWLVRSEHRVRMEKTGLVANGGVVSGLFCDVSSILSGGMVRMLGVVESFTVSFGYYLLCCFFSGLDGVVSINIGV
ncbi:hypothetical protein G9A89_008587 [Geosiphon pyriformis]|nr:hypothetical protein G9A89_008587 [Geosiphon pyriformis]